MYSLSQLQTAQINPEVAKEAFTQVERRLIDLLETKKNHEQKASVLLTGFTTLALALIGAGGALLKDGAALHLGSAHVPLAFAIAGLPLVLSAWCMIRALQPAPYGNLGSEPKMWLNAGTIDAETSVVPLMQAYITYYMQERIEVSENSNNSRAKLIESGIKCALASPVVLFAGLVVAIGLA